MRIAAILALSLWAADEVRAQEAHFNETHRVILRNGNMLDGILRESIDSGIVFIYSPSVRMFIRWGDIRSIEEIKIRTLRSEPKRILPPPPPSADPSEKTPTPPPEKDPAPPPNLKLPAIPAALQQKIDDLLDRVRSTPRISRGRYAQALDSLGTEARQYMAVRIELLSDDLVRWTASEIGRSGDRNLVQPLRQRLNSERPVVRSVAIQLLQELRDLDSRPYVVRLLKDPDEGVRGAAAVALPDLGDESSIAPLLEMSREPSGAIRKVALRAVTELARRKGRLAEVVTYWQIHARSYPTAPREDVTEAAGLLIPSLGSGEGDPAGTETRAAAEEMLVGLAGDSEPAVRAAAYRSLGKLNSTGARETLSAALASEANEAAAIAAIGACQEIRDRAAIPGLIERLGQSSDRIRDAAWSALKMITGELNLPADQQEWESWLKRQ